MSLDNVANAFLSTPQQVYGLFSKFIQRLPTFISLFLSELKLLFTIIGLHFHLLCV